MGHYDEQYEETERQHRENMKKSGYVHIDLELRPLFGNKVWVHKNEIGRVRKSLKFFLGIKK